ncbi:hypothetical protein GCM10027027_16780 [Neomicrococcus lactis]
MPTKKTPTASIGNWDDHSAVAIPIAAHRAAKIMVARSPNRAVSTAAGTFIQSEPSPMIMIIAAARPVEAPSDNAVKDTIGVTAPSPTEYSKEGV